MIRFVLAEKQDCMAFYKATMTNDCLVWKIEVDGVLHAAFGAKMYDDYIVVFSDVLVKPTLPKITIWRVAAKALQVLQQFNKPMYAYAEQKSRFLESLGFYLCSEEDIGSIICTYRREVI